MVFPVLRRYIEHTGIGFLEVEEAAIVIAKNILSEGPGKHAGDSAEPIEVAFAQLRGAADAKLQIAFVPCV